MTLNEILAVLNKIKFYLFGLLFLVAVALAVYIYLDNPNGNQGFGKLPNPEFKSVFSSEVKLQSKATFSKDIPRELNVYSFGKNTEGAQIGSKFGFTTAPVSGEDTQVWSEGSKQLALSLKQQTFEYTDTGRVETKTLSAEQAYDKAILFLKKTELIGSDIELTKKETKYLVGDHELEETTIVDGALIYVFYIGAKLDNMSLVNEFGSETIYIAWVGVDGKLVKLSGTAKRLVFEEKSTYPVEHLRTVKEMIVDNQATVVSTTAGLDVTKTKEYSVVYRTNAEVYYLEKGDQELLQPVVLVSTGEDYTSQKLTALMRILKARVYK